MGIKKTIDKNDKKYVPIEYVESWIIGFPIKTEYGDIIQFKVEDYYDIIGELELLKKQGWEIKNQILKSVETKEIRDKIKSDFDNNSFITCVRNNVCGLRNEYIRIFSMFIDDFEKKFIWTISQEEFDRIRKLILELNNITHQEKNPNEEIERFNKMKNFMNRAKGGVLEFDTIYSTLMTKEGGGLLPSEINSLTMRQFYLAFKRVEFNKAHDVTTLFKTVDSKDTIKIVDWNQSSREEEQVIEFDSLDDLKKNNGFMAKKGVSKKSGNPNAMTPKSNSLPKL